VRRLNAYGLEVVSGIILGLDTDSPETVDHILAFIEASQIPMLTINILYALPKTPLWRRLEDEGRLSRDTERESNVVFRQPHEAVVAGWRRCIATTYTPEAVYRRFAHQLQHTFPNRERFPVSPHRASWRNIIGAAGVLGQIVWRIGIRAGYRRTFWRLAGPALRAGRVEEVINIAVVAHHLIEFARDCVQGTGESSFYAPTIPTAPATTPSAAA
jgi:hopanoid C-2 methylase